jgi:NitT/TauT family transport system substrate-binding protein
MLADDVYPPSVDITADTLKVWMDTQIALGKFASQPDYETFVGAQTHRARARDE